MRNLKEVLLDTLSSTSVFEQALNRSDVINKVVMLGEQIVQNWALILYTNENDPENTNINHWKTELRAHCKTISKSNIKGGSRGRAIRYAFLEKLEYNKTKNVFEDIYDKFESEGLPRVYAQEISEYISKNIDELISAIVEKDYVDWIENL